MTLLKCDGCFGKTGMKLLYLQHHTTIINKYFIKETHSWKQVLNRCFVFKLAITIARLFTGYIISCTSNSLGETNPLHPRIQPSGCSAKSKSRNLVETFFYGF
uniref:Uncharacterized protein n=1 Tax=Cacopsylla melanoneura TaxID=428564 RepID=A0A8D8T7I0_9HEMI